MRERRSYLSFMLGPFFRWWWALATGVATFLSYVLTPEAGIAFTRVGALLLTLAGSTVLFLAVTSIIQGWSLFAERYRDMTVCSVQRSRDFGGEWVFVLEGYRASAIGTVLDIHRQLGDVQVPFALVEVRATTSKGKLQASPLWLSPAHVREFNAGKFTAADMVVLPHPTLDRIREALGVGR